MPKQITHVLYEAPMLPLVPGQVLPPEEESVEDPEDNQDQDDGNYDPSNPEEWDRDEPAESEESTQYDPDETPTIPHICPSCLEEIAQALAPPPESPSPEVAPVPEPPREPELATRQFAYRYLLGEVYKKMRQFGKTYYFKKMSNGIFSAHNVTDEVILQGLEESVEICVSLPVSSGADGLYPYVSKSLMMDFLKALYP
jgi:hypothetical protein